MTTAELEQRFDELKAQVMEKLAANSSICVADLEPTESGYRETLLMGKEGGWAVLATGGGYPLPPNSPLDTVLEVWAGITDPMVRRLLREYFGKQAQKDEDVLARIDKGKEKIEFYIEKRRNELLQGLIESMERALEQLR